LVPYPGVVVDISPLAIGFGYFENLIRCGNVNRIECELARLTNLNEFIEKVGGHETWLFEDMVSETFELFQGILSAMSGGQDPMVLLMEKFNDPEPSRSIVYHLRLLASSWLKGNPNDFEPYIPGSISNYIDGTVMPVDQEIDAICVSLLVELLLKPANMVLDIAYLDRSEGAEVTNHRMPDDAGQDSSNLGLTIYLLYRPGHYDILYRDILLEPQPAPVVPTSLQVNRVASFTHQHDIQSTVPCLHTFTDNELSELALMPAFGPTGLASPTESSPMTASFAPSPQSAWIPQHYPEAIAGPQGIPQQPTPPQQQPQIQQQQQQQQQHPASSTTIHPLRFSKYNFPGLPEMAETNINYEPTFTTNTFKNSHFNIAHYSNNNFQPEMYRPEADEMPTQRSGGRKKSSEHCAGVKKGGVGS
jgi:ubiquitin thioesterase protein OTUB1